MQKKNKVVQFRDGWARVIVCDDASEFIGVPDTFVNPNLSNVAGISPEFWEIKNGVISAMSDEDRVRRRSDIIRITSDLSTSEEARKWMTFIDGELLRLGSDNEMLAAECNKLIVLSQQLRSEIAATQKSYESLMSKALSSFSSAHSTAIGIKSDVASLVRDIAVLREGTDKRFWNAVWIAAIVVISLLGVIYGSK